MISQMFPKLFFLVNIIQNGFKPHSVWYGAQNINTCLASGSSIAIWTGAYVWINTESAIGTSRPKIKEN